MDASNHHYAWPDLGEDMRTFDTMSDFLDDYEYLDDDYNLCIRWDIREHSVHPERFEASIIILYQRKGRMGGCKITEIVESEMPRFYRYLLQHWDYIRDMWEPISGAADGKHLDFFGVSR